MTELSRVTEESFRLWAALVLDTFAGDWQDPSDIDLLRQLTDLDRAWGVVDGGSVVGTVTSLTARITLPWGGAAPMATVSNVTVRPTHRRQGLLSRMMRRQLSEIHDRGEPLAGLWASEAAIYPRFGYGLGTYAAWLRVRRPASAYRRPLRVEHVTEVDREAAMDAFPPIEEACAPGRPGYLVRSPRLWAEAFADPEGARGGSSRRRYVLHQNGAAPDGYASYRTVHAWGPTGERESRLEVQDLQAANAEAYATLWRYCLDVDLFVQVGAGHRSVDEPLRHLLLDARALESRVQDGLWLRLVDASDALCRRGYGGEGELVLELHDETCPWNEGRLLLSAGREGAAVTPTTREPDLVLDAATLAALYLGGTQAGILHRAGRIEACRRDALSRADRLFAAEATPWCPTGF